MHALLLYWDEERDITRLAKDRWLNTVRQRDTDYCWVRMRRSADSRQSVCSSRSQQDIHIDSTNNKTTPRYLRHAMHKRGICCRIRNVSSIRLSATIRYSIKMA